MCLTRMGLTAALVVATAGGASSSAAQGVSGDSVLITPSTKYHTGGFGIFLLASMVNTQNFGFLAASGAAVAFAADLVVAPALMTLATRSDRKVHATSPNLPATAPGEN